MKVILSICLVLLGLLSSICHAQINSPQEWNRERLLRERKAMQVLTVWGNVNLTSGVVLGFTSQESELKWFSAMNAGFGAVNTTLGILGMRRTKKQLSNLPSLEQGYSDLRKTRNILLVNAGLDVGYIVTGIVLRDAIFIGRSSSLEREKQKGFSTSLIVQGAALLIFDSITAWSLSKSEIHISPVLTPNGAGIGFQSNLQKQAPQGVAWF